MSIVQRFALLALLLVVEGLLIFVHVRDEELSAIARWGVAFATFFVILGYPRAMRAIRHISSEAERVPISWALLGLHLCFAAVVFFSPAMMAKTSGVAAVLLIGGWTAACVCGIVLAGLAFAPLRTWIDVLRTTGHVWIYAALVASAASRLAPAVWSVWDHPLWKTATDLTFWSVKLLLGLVVSEVVSDRTALTIGSSKFSVTVGGQCSGWEGAGLALIFTSVWLFMFRRDCRFPRALVLIPAGMALMFVLNAVRIAALILIGHAGAPRVAIGGFHSQAGWIAFNAVALGICWAAPRSRWLSVQAPARVQGGASEQNPTVPYLLPFVAILAAGMISRAAAANFEWLYPLRFFAAAGAIWYCRRKYAELQWRAGWPALLAGGVMFVVWLALDRGSHSDSGIATGLAQLPAPARISWLVFRTVAAVVTVPLAEELAFRGFLLRRLISSDFERVSFRRFSYVAVLGSSLAFGMMHGDRWLAGTLAGMLYAAVMLRRGSIGDAVAAHATTNGLLAVWVLVGGNWHLW